MWWSHLKWDLLALSLLIAGYTGYSFLQEPLEQQPDEVETEGSRPPDQTEGDVVLLLPDAPAAPANDFSELDCSYGWYSALWQHYGSFATALSRHLSPEFLAGRSVVIVPRRVAREMPPNGITALASFARQGGQVVLEQPGEGWERLTGISSSGETRDAQSITSVEGLDVRGRLRNHLPDVPLTGSLAPAPAMDPWPQGPAMLEVDTQPGLVTRRLESGIVHTFLFEFSCTLTALQQGKPDGDMTFDGSGHDELVPTAARVADASMKTADVPYADILELAFFQQLSESRPLPRLWPYPGSHAGALLVVHPTSGELRPTLGFLDYAHRSGVHASALVPSDRVSPSKLKVARKTDAEIGLHWIRGLERPPVTETVGIGALQPLAQELSLRRQLDQLEGDLPEDERVRLIRNEGATHSREWARTFRRMAAADLRLDVSYGPVDPEHHGYLFGTGFPFYPIDKQGLPLPVLELPFVLHASNLTRDRLRTALTSSENFYHQSIAISIPGDAMRTEPTAGLLLAYRDAFELADEHDHWRASAGDFADFLSARRRSVLTSQWNPESRRLTVSVNLIGARVDSLESGAIPGVAVPRTHDREPIDRIVVDDESYPLEKLGSTGTGYEQIVELPPGRHTVSIFYEAPPTDDASPDAGTDG